MFGIGGVEFILILLFVFIVFGADRLPEIARVLGKAIAKFRKAQAEMNAAIQSDVNNLETDEQPFQKSVEAFDKLGREMVDTAKKTANDVSRSGIKAKGASPAPATVAGAAAANAKGAAAEGVEESAAQTAKAAAPSPAATATAAAAPKPTVAPSAPPKRESFTERKARYEAERARREAAKAAETAAAPAPEAAPAPAAPAVTEEGKGE